MNSLRVSLIAVIVVIVGTAALLADAAQRATASAPPTYGTLSNFDVYNDTGEEAHGFEIELDGISASDVTYEFGAPYERYGNPTVVPFQGGVDVIYQSPWDPTKKTFTQGTPVPPGTPAATGGHECWTGGSANYPTRGCEHFGLALAANPTNVAYHWLVVNPKKAGRLMTFGKGVAMPAPQWSTSSPPPGPNQKPVVAAAVVAPEPDQGQQLGDAIWVKVFSREAPSAADLGHLLSGDGKVPSKGEVETEWLLIQNGAGGGLQTELQSEGQLGKKSNSVTRRYQFFAYTGAYDPDNHEALVVNDSHPSAGELGKLIGNNMGALNLKKGDIVRPTARFTTHPAQRTPSHGATFTIAAKDNVSKTFTYFCSLDKKIPSKCSASVTLRGLKKGHHVFSAYAADGARNASRAVRYSWTVR